MRRYSRARPDICWYYNTKKGSLSIPVRHFKAGIDRQRLAKGKNSVIIIIQG